MNEELSAEEQDRILKSMKAVDARETESDRMTMRQPKYVLNGMKEYAKKKGYRNVNEMLRDLYFKALKEEVDQ